MLLTGALNYWVVRRYTKSLETALLSSLFYVTSGDILFYFSMLGEIDIFYTFLAYCQVIFIFAGYEQKRWMWLFIGSYFFTAAGLLTKGLPSLAFQGITLLAVAGYKGQWRWLFAFCRHWFVGHFGRRLFLRVQQLQQCGYLYPQIIHRIVAAQRPRKNNVG